VQPLQSNARHIAHAADSGESAVTGLVLALDTSTPLGGAALGRAGVVLGEVVIGERTRHAESLLPAVRFLLDNAGASMAAVGGIVVGAGPGSFTGVRIAAATAKGLAHALDVPLLAYPSLAAAAATAAQADRPVCALFDARRDEVYAACYRFSGLDGIETLIEPSPRALDDLLAEALPLDAIFAGEGAVLHAEAIAAAGGTVAPAHLGVPRASALLWLAHVAPAAGVVDARSWEPAYLRPSGAERRAS
jgi:tRNA threonylcarbamoyladenosine biosynthesis protein TsaB